MVRNRHVRLVVILVFQTEKPAPRFAVLPNDLSGGGRTDNPFISARLIPDLSMLKQQIQRGLPTVEEPSIWNYLCP